MRALRRPKLASSLRRAGLSVCCFVALVVGCGQRADTSGAGAPVVLRFPGSRIGAEGRVLERQLARFERDHPGIQVELEATPDSADERHQLFVQWLNAGARTPDVLQLDIVWLAEFASAGWIVPLDGFAPPSQDFFPAALEASQYRGKRYALPWFIDVGMLYWRTDLLPEPPRSLRQLADFGRQARELGVADGMVWQAARYEGLVTTYLELLGGFGGSWMKEGHVTVDEPPGVAALEFMRHAMAAGSGFVPRQALGWQEEACRFAFQRGEALMMRNWPYAARLLEHPTAGDPSAAVGRFAVAPMPGTPAGRATATLGGAQLAINAHSQHPRQAYLLLEFLTAPEQMLERAELAGQLPARRAPFTSERLAQSLVVDPGDLMRVIDSAVPRPVTPLYTELSARLQIALHRALSGQSPSAAALGEAAREMRTILRERGAPRTRPATTAFGAWDTGWLAALGAALLATSLLARRWWRRRATLREQRRLGAATCGDARLAWPLMSPALLTVAGLGVAPLLWTFWESLHRRDLRFPGSSADWVGLDQYAAALSDGHLGASLGRTLLFTGASVSLELLIGVALALVLAQRFRGRAWLQAAALLPWALPTVVAALVWRFLFDGDTSVVSQWVEACGLSAPAWLAHPKWAWLPWVLADVWKTAPFVGLILLAGLQTIEPRLYEAARIDGAARIDQFLHITLPLLRPSLLVALVFRSLDAFRVFDLAYVLTGGGPGNATEPVALYTFSTLLQQLRFGYGSALSVIVLCVALTLAWLYVRLLRAHDGRLAQ